ncbi:MAG: hypothetical protein ABIJ59_04305 [Pseudomonadota bacterium]
MRTAIEFWGGYKLIVTMNLYWKLYLSESSPERTEIVEYLDLILGRTVKKDFRHKILLDTETCCDDEYHLGSVIYPDRTFSEFSLRKNEWLTLTHNRHDQNRCVVDAAYRHYQTLIFSGGWC